MPTSSASCCRHCGLATWVYIVGVLSSLLPGRHGADDVDPCAHVASVISSSLRHGHMGWHRRCDLAAWPALPPWPGHMGPHCCCCVADMMLTTQISGPMCPRCRCHVVRLAGGGAAAMRVHQHLKLASQSVRGMGPMSGDDSVLFTVNNFIHVQKK